MSLLRQTTGHYMRSFGRPLPPSSRHNHHTTRTFHLPIVVTPVSSCIASTSSTLHDTAGSALLATKQQLTGHYVPRNLIGLTASLSQSLDDFIDNLMTIPTLLFAKYPPSMNSIDDDEAEL
ncbi:hypothetical protein SPRG_00530 [Saprolegnia parasitica CBS 223.65]|uniref:Uncharacterized protein n=1 Tax=Saprolegnia parasitica (strain CBS 223.65) TaxID=695850 RepID=A0A067D6Z9_SAPPC|nr:hypothetical protein SPRG_00530 [Saprolegnia parasitica CBS 223.65]KDO34466.1 hypothetical protein SPRG_00530 [Saprolegnia parasitica CBS 223.65]|eukprot:XP_012194147.1 hypothetical protein SPRG_00530 [Saprolegnia parasitica CBS 223.65]